MTGDRDELEMARQNLAQARRFTPRTEWARRANREVIEQLQRHIAALEAQR